MHAATPSQTTLLAVACACSLVCDTLGALHELRPASAPLPTWRGRQGSGYDAGDGLHYLDALIPYSQRAPCTWPSGVASAQPLLTLQQPRLQPPAAPGPTTPTPFSLLLSPRLQRAWLMQASALSTQYAVSSVIEGSHTGCVRSGW